MGDVECVGFNALESAINGHLGLCDEWPAGRVGAFCYPDGSGWIAAHGHVHRILQIVCGIVPRGTVLHARTRGGDIYYIVFRFGMNGEGHFVCRLIAADVRPSLLDTGISTQVSVKRMCVYIIVSAQIGANGAGLKGPVANGVVHIHACFGGGAGEVRVSHTGAGIVGLQGDGATVSALYSRIFKRVVPAGVSRQLVVVGSHLVAPHDAVVHEYVIVRVKACSACHGRVAHDVAGNELGGRTGVVHPSASASSSVVAD